MSFTNPASTAFAMTTHTHQTEKDGEITLFTPQAEGSFPGYYKDVYAYKLRELVKPGDYVVEIGTAIGLIPVLLHRWFNGSVRWSGCEPMLWNYLATFGSCVINGIEPDLSFHGLGVPPGMYNFAMGAANVGGCTQRDAAPELMSCTGRLVHPAEYFLNRQPNVIILDCEGGEYTIAPFLPACRVIVGESHPHLTTLVKGQSQEDLIKTLTAKAEVVIFGQA